MTSKMFRLVIASLALAPALALAQVPATVGFSARIADNGRPVDGTHSFTFKLWNCPEPNGTDCIADDPSAPSPNVIWKQDTTTGVTDGVLTVVLDGSSGAPMPFPPNVFDGNARWLEVVMDGTAFSPKMWLNSVPFAYTANRAFSAANADLASNLACSGCVSDSEITGISGSKVSGTVANATNATNLNNIAASGYLRFASGGTGTTASVSGQTVSFSNNYYSSGGNYGYGSYPARYDHTHSLNCYTYSNSAPAANGTRPQVTATCGSGTIVGGGFMWTYYGATSEVSMPSGNGWYATGTNNSGSTSTLTVYARCCSL